MCAHQEESWHWTRAASWFPMGKPNGEPTASVDPGASRLLSCPGRDLTDAGRNTDLAPSGRTRPVAFVMSGRGLSGPINCYRFCVAQSWARQYPRSRAYLPVLDWVPEHIVAGETAVSFTPRSGSLVRRFVHTPVRPGSGPAQTEIIDYPFDVNYWRMRPQAGNRQCTAHGNRVSGTFSPGSRPCRRPWWDVSAGGLALAREHGASLTAGRKRWRP